MRALGSVACKVLLLALLALCAGNAWAQGQGFGLGAEWTASWTGPSLPGSGTIVTANTYQTLFPAKTVTHGFLCSNTSPAGSRVWIDLSGATGTALSSAAQPIDPAPSAGSAPGQFLWPRPVSNQITIYGPVGATLNCVGS